MNSNPADSDFAEHAALEAETPPAQRLCLNCNSTLTSDELVTCEVCLDERYYDGSYDCGCCSCCGCTCDLYEDDFIADMEGWDD